MNTSRVILVIVACAALTLAQRFQDEFSECFTPLGEEGLCVSIRKCPNLLTHLSRSKYPGGQQSAILLRESLCSFRGQDPIVCCSGRISGTRPTPGPENRLTVWKPNNGSGGNGGRIIPFSPAPKTGHFAHKNAKLLPVNCGDSYIHIRIVGGKQTDMGEHPWLAAIEYRTRRGVEVLCGGALINDRYVLTAAHCIRVPPGNTLLALRLGEHNLMTERDCYRDTAGREKCADDPIKVGIESVKVHEKYDPSARHNDIALIRLSRKVSATTYVKPVCLPLSETLSRSLFTGTKNEVAGWGRTENSPSSDVKLKVELSVIDNQRCAKLYRDPHPNVQLDSTQMCAGGEQGKDSCGGDSGGPLVVLRNDTWFVTGVVSYGPSNCGTQDLPGIYTRVTSYIPWILDNLAP
ncbi:CLIP domain-containing serine protease B4-like [Neocloeon triangulifer]|uniref:CLIP domain-containing serine protease B4-like n=1 Tax=Neocloeon triangulifer TaxID=2078957 RepID=UPI00286ED713|nr:CLIP domain-containing serine protease B4-like [Neocloeon triangulifer]